MSEENDELLGMFVQEAAEHLETIEPDLLIMEERGADTEQEVIHRLFRAIHSIKGSAGFFGLTNITRLSHMMENLMGRVRDRALQPSEEVSESLLSGLDKLKGMIGDVANSETIDASEEIAVIEGVLSGSGGTAPAKPVAQVSAPSAAAGAPAPEPATTGGDDAPHRFDLTNHVADVAEAVSHGRRFLAVLLKLPAAPKERATHFSKIATLVGSVGDVVATHPPVDLDTPKLDKLSGVSLLVTTVLESDLLSNLLQIPSEQLLDIKIPAELAKASKATAKPAPKKAPAPQRAEVESDEEELLDGDEESGSRPALVNTASRLGGAKGKLVANGGGGDGATKSGTPSVEETLRVSVNLLDELINNAGELVLARNQLLRASAQVISQFPAIGPLVQNLNTITSRIQEKVMQARMQPVSVVFNKFPRIIRDLARKLEKKIDLTIRGGEVELDKSVIEHLSDPLTHMIRNVADHAIEAPAERLQMRKPETGQVELAAYHENGMVNISLTDDGGGIDHEKIRLKALEKGLITEHQADVMSETDALNLIFAPGFSMAKKISDVSGRGVGMDVVRTNIEKLGGTVHIDSKVGKGTRITLKLPLTLAIIPAMIVSSGNQRFAIPEVGLVEIVRITESDRANEIEMVGNAPVLRLRNNLLPLVDLSDVLGITRFWPPGSKTPDRRTRLADRRAVSKRANEDAFGTDKGSSAKQKQRKERREEDDESGRREPTGLVAYIMVINVSGNEFGMVVDEVLDSEEIVVKPIPSFFKDNPCFSATTILGDGSVALIIDYAGVMETAKINFTSTERASRMDLDDERRNALRERQNIILLETGSGALMGIVHGMIRRVEKISPSLLEQIGGRPYVRYDRKTFRAVYPDQVLGLESTHHGEAEAGADLCMVVPNIPGLQAGLIFSKIIDTREISIDLDCRAIKANGLFGSSQIDDRVVLFPDIYTIFDLAGIAPPNPPKRINGSGLKALVVDDTPFLRNITSSYLSGLGFVVEQAEDGQAALNLLKGDRYDLLVSDLGMPLLDGFELAREVPTTLNPDIPMIATTTSISAQLEERCAQSGFVSCVSTIDKNRLLSVVASLKQ